MNNGVLRIADERLRQVEQEGYSITHDDEHTRGQLARAAGCYAALAGLQASGWSFKVGLPLEWPWASTDWKPSDDPIRNLEKAGALIAAEIDRLLRLEGKNV